MFGLVHQLGKLGFAAGPTEREDSKIDRGDTHRTSRREITATKKMCAPCHVGRGARSGLRDDNTWTTRLLVRERCGGVTHTSDGWTIKKDA